MDSNIQRCIHMTAVEERRAAEAPTSEAAESQTYLVTTCREMIPTEAAISADHEQLSTLAHAQLGQSEGLDLPGY